MILVGPLFEGTRDRPWPWCHLASDLGGRPGAAELAAFVDKLPRPRPGYSPKGEPEATPPRPGGLFAHFVLRGHERAWAVGLGARGVTLHALLARLRVEAGRRPKGAS